MKEEEIEKALNWIDLAHEVCKDARPITAEEHATIKEFFWSQFKDNKKDSS